MTGNDGRSSKNGLLVFGFAGEHFADASDGFTLGVSKGEEFEAVAEAVAIAHDGADFQWVGAEGQGNFEGDDFAFLEFPGESGADAILTEFGGVSPAVLEVAVLEHADVHAGVDGKTGKAARVGRFGGSEFFAG